jgi:16S rRNA (guanine527-N7)-methyltransferase
MSSPSDSAPTDPLPTDLADQVADILRAHLPAGAPGADTIEELAAFCAALAATNQHINLTGVTDPQGMALRHVLDSLTVSPLLQSAASLMDLGSGGGLPGIPLAIAHPELTVTLVESRERKAAALAELVESLGLSPRVTAVHARGEKWLAEHEVDIVVARAVDQTARLLKTLRPVREQFGRLILMKGPKADEELATVKPRLASLGFRYPEVHEAALPEEAGRRVLLVFDEAG